MKEKNRNVKFDIHDIQLIFILRMCGSGGATLAYSFFFFFSFFNIND